MAVKYQQIYSNCDDNGPLNICIITIFTTIIAITIFMFASKIHAGNVQ